MGAFPGTLALGGLPATQAHGHAARRPGESRSSARSVDLVVTAEARDDARRARELTLAVVAEAAAKVEHNLGATRIR